MNVSNIKMDDAEIFRLFLGMGSIWYFEIISSFIGNTGGEGWSHFSIVPDLINAMQLNYVCAMYNAQTTLLHTTYMIVL